jgi:hypothetical protein
MWSTVNLIEVWICVLGDGPSVPDVFDEHVAVKVSGIVWIEIVSWFDKSIADKEDLPFEPRKRHQDEYQPNLDVLYPM